MPGRWFRQNNCSVQPHCPPRPSFLFSWESPNLQSPSTKTQERGYGQQKCQDESLTRSAELTGLKDTQKRSDPFPNSRPHWPSLYPAAESATRRLRGHGCCRFWLFNTAYPTLLGACKRSMSYCLATNNLILKQFQGHTILAILAVTSNSRHKDAVKCIQMLDMPWEAPSSCCHLLYVFSAPGSP